MFTHSLIKKLCCLILLSATFVVKAQQVKKIDCCKDLSSKATIIINDNTSTANGSTSSSSSATSNNTYGTFNFEITSSANTSAGVFDASNNLVRTLWGGVRYDVGCYQGQWDGLLDDGSQAANGTYQVKILTNNMQYTWEGGVGNTSTDLTGDYVTKAIPFDLAFIAGKGYAATGYSEHGSTQKEFDVSDPNKWLSSLNDQTTQSSEGVCTDGTTLFWSGGDYYSGDYWIFGAYPANNSSPYASMVPFSAGVVEDNNNAAGHSYYSNAISVVKGMGDAGKVTSSCVQKSGNYLFAARNGMNQLQVINKSTGATVQTLTFQGVKGSSCDNSGHLFLVYGNKVSKFSVNSDGTLSDLGVAFPGITTPGRMDISPDFGTIAVSDDATQQVKFFSVNGGSPVGTLGQSGGYATNPIAANDRFYSVSFLRYQPDGSVWIGDKENYRAVHFDANLIYLNQISRTPSLRNACVDQNNPTRVFAGLVEYAVDYSKPLDNGANGSWKLKANWKANYTYKDETFNDYVGFRSVQTLSNNRTYATLYQSDGNYKEVELGATGMRYTGADQRGDVGRDGTFFSVNSAGNYTQAIRQLLTGFDSNNNPVRANSTVFSSTPSGIDIYDQPGTPYNYVSGLTASADKYIWFNNGTPQRSFADHPTFTRHLGATKQGDNKYTWQTAQANRTDYYGPFPHNGDWDVGGGVNSAKSDTHVMVYDDAIFFNQNAELSRFVETNEWNHFDLKTGLFIGHFGTNAAESRIVTSNPAMMAGNAFGYQMCKVNGYYYIYHCDESYHAFIHRWKVSGLETINITTVPITISGPVTLPADATDLMAGVTYYSSGFYGGSGWTMNPSAYDAHSYGDQYPDWRVTTGSNTYLQPENDIDIVSDDNANGAYKTVSRTLGTNNTSSWTLSGAFKLNSNINDKTNYDVLDASGKVLVTFITGKDNNLYVNGTAYQSGVFDDRLCPYRFTDFKIQDIAGKVSFSINNLPAVTINSPPDSGGNFNQPGSFRVRAGGSGDQNHSLISIKGLRFATN